MISTDKPCRHRCRHADCAMERGDPLPDPVAVAYWPDGKKYEPKGAADISADTVNKEPEET